MKKYASLLIGFVMISLLLPGSVIAKVYFLGVGATGGRISKTSYGLEVGFIPQKTNTLIWLGGGFIIGSYELIEHGRDVLGLGFYFDKERSENEGFVSLGLGILKSFFLVITPAYSVVTESSTLYSGNESSPGWGKKDVETNFGISGQLRFVEDNFIVGVGYHSRRGLIGVIGFSF